jgi:hypothetical protein
MLEVSLFAFYVGTPPFATIIEKMSRCGFIVYDILGEHNRPLDETLAQVEVAFVKEGGMFRCSHRYWS